MKDINKINKQIFNDMKQCIKDLGLKILDEKDEGGILFGLSKRKYPGYNMNIVFSYDPADNKAEVLMQYADLPAEKLPALYELINHINCNLLFNHFIIDSGPRILGLRSGIKVIDNFLNKKVFKWIMSHNLGVGHKYMPFIATLIFTNETPQSIMDVCYSTRDTIPPQLLGSNGTWVAAKTTKEHQFTIDACLETPAFSTHTHGLTELGMPEFLMDLLSFGADGTGSRIKWSYEYFVKPENVGKLDAIKNGETVKLSIIDLKPDATPETYVYCYRRVYPELEMVKMAYAIESPTDVDPSMSFIQIYIEGDDFALKDDYYKGGIKW